MTVDRDTFDLPEELQEFRGLVREIVEERIGLDRAAEIDEADEYPWDVHKIFVENELMSVGYPEEFGGSGGGSLIFAVMVEEISRVSAGCALIPLVSRLGAILLLGVEAATWAAAYRLLGALPDNKLAMLYSHRRCSSIAQP